MTRKSRLGIPTSDPCGKGQLVVFGNDEFQIQTLRRHLVD